MAGTILLGPVGQADGRNRLLRIQPPAVRRSDPTVRVVGQAAANARISAPRIAVRRRQRGRDIGARAKAGIDQPLLPQSLQRVGVKDGALGLDDRRSVMGQPQPGQILEYAVDELGPAAAGVEILDAEQEFSPAGTGMGVAERRRKGMAQVQEARWRGGETCDLQDSLHDKGDRGDS